MEEGEALLRRSVEIACEAREMYHNIGCKVSCDATGNGEILKQRPVLVAASVGSYGAYLADGSEYRCIHWLLLSIVAQIACTICWGLYA